MKENMGAYFGNDGGDLVEQMKNSEVEPCVVGMKKNRPRLINTSESTKICFLKGTLMQI